MSGGKNKKMKKGKGAILTKPPRKWGTERKVEKAEGV